MLELESSNVLTLKKAQFAPQNSSDIRKVHSLSPSHHRCRFLTLIASSARQNGTVGRNLFKCAVLRLVVVQPNCCACGLQTSSVADIIDHNRCFYSEWFGEGRRSAARKNDCGSPRKLGAPYLAGN